MEYGPGHQKASVQLRKNIRRHPGQTDHPVGVFHQTASVGVVVLFGRRVAEPGFLLRLKQVQGEGL